MINSASLNFRPDNSPFYITFPQLDKIDFIKNAFTTRLGGVSKGIYSTMNMSFTNGDNRDDVLENYRIICSELNVDINKVVLSHQTHTNNVRIITEDDIGKGIFKERDYDNVDGLITNVKGIVLVTQYADCTPLLFCDPVKKVIATSHAGWRGTAQEIGRITVEKMCSHFGCSPENIIAAIGPSICKDCYEVDSPVYEPISKINYLDTDKIFVNKGGGKYMLDLWETNRQILINAGLRPDNIDVTDLCTNCNPNIFHSHRYTGGKRGNLAAIISLV
ncbi:MAG: peptidoglycan editing factor PgeF [Acutalibacteraceae bacterium]|nr:peptidoglycan editing factor PgeF [Acutalibacteraceae bacterium]